MAEVSIRPLLAHEPEVTPPGRRWILLLPALMAVLGILIATAAAISGQDRGRELEASRKKAALLSCENQLQLARANQAGAAEISRLIGALEDARRDMEPSPFVEPGRHFTQWDGNRYEEIVTDGYVYHMPGDSDDVKNARMIMKPGWDEPRVKDVVWFPLYPSLAWLVAKGTGMSAASALTLVSQVCLVLAAVVIFLYARRHYYNRMPKLNIGEAPSAEAAERHPSRRWDLMPEDSAAVWAVAVLLYGPCSVFLYANFTESLFVLLLAAFLYCLQGRWWWRAAVIAALASACRSQGALFAPTLAVVFLLRSDVRNPAAKLSKAAALGVVSVVGLICYMIYLQVTFGDSLAFVHAQAHWNVGINAKTIFHALNPVNAMTHFMKFAVYTRPVDWPRLWEAFCVIGPPVMLLILGGRFLSFELEMMGWLMWALPFVSNSLAGSPPGDTAWMSMGRFMMVLIPAHIIVGAVLVRFRWLGIPFLAAWASAFAVFAFKFGMGEWIG